MSAFRVLGPVEVWHADERLPTSGPRQVALLAYLLLHAKRAVSREQLHEALWPGQAADGAVKRVHVAVARLRAVLEPLRRAAAGAPVLRTVTGGYVLGVAEGDLDAGVFAREVERGRRELDAGRPGEASARLRAALALWTRPALADVANEDFAVAEIRRLVDLLLLARELRIEAELDILARLYGDDPDALLDALERAARAQLVHEAAGEIGRYAFAHALIRDVAYQSLSGARCGRLHQRAGAAIEAASADPDASVAEPARHFGLSASAADLDTTVPILAFCVVACARLGDRVAAGRVHAELEPFAGLFVNTGGSWFGAVDHHLAQLRAAAGATTDADAAFAGADAAYERLGADARRARCRIDWARSLLQRGAPDDRRRAGDMLAGALAAAGELDLPAVARRASELRAACGT